MKRFARRAASVAWPAFLTASALELLVFAFVDPSRLLLLDGSELEWSAATVYSLAFFAFWAAAAVGGLCTLILHSSAEEINSEGVGSSP